MMPDMYRNSFSTSAIMDVWCDFDTFSTPHNNTL
jgi:hypothetical protein